MPAFGLVVITAPKIQPHTPALLSGLLERQMTVHLRKPGYPTVELRELLKAIPQTARRNVVLHTCHELAEEFDVKAQRASGTASRSASCIAYYSSFKSMSSEATQGCAGLTLSTSLHSLDQLSQDYGALDYAFISPVFDSVSKEGYEAAFQHQQLKEELSKCKFPVYALGGVTTDNIGLLGGMGFKGAAVLGAVWCAPDPVREAERMQHAADVAMTYA